MKIDAEKVVEALLGNESVRKLKYKHIYDQSARRILKSFWQDPGKLIWGFTIICEETTKFVNGVRKTFVIFGYFF